MSTTNKRPTLLLSRIDVERIEALLDNPQYRGLNTAALRDELERAELAEPAALPSDLITMNTTALVSSPATRSVAKASQRYVYGDYRIVELLGRRNAQESTAQLAAEIEGMSSAARLGVQRVYGGQDSAFAGALGLGVLIPEYATVNKRLSA